jgi:nucleotide-binding universal stress UspA family protein
VIQKEEYMRTKTLKQTSTKTLNPLARNPTRVTPRFSRKQEADRPKLKLKVIVVPVDFSAESKKALSYASKLAAGFGAVLRVIHVVETAPFLNDLPNAMLTRSENEIAREALVKLQALAQDEINELIPVQPEVRIGKPFREIVGAAKVLGADLIVIATHGYTGLKHALLGSTAERVVQHAPCPVLVVRESQNEFI